MASNDFDVEFFEKKLQSLKDSQESIQNLSSWCLERRQHHKKIVATWLQVLKKVKVEHRLTLFYLANDVIQYSKRKNFEFVESWGTTLQRATTMVRDEKVKHRILRIFKIWDQRQVYDEEFLADLSGLISAAPKKKSEPQPINAPDEFQSAQLITLMRSCATLETATDARLKDLRDSHVDIDNAEELCASLKDRRLVEDAEKEVETAVKSVEDYVLALEAEIRERTQLIDLLEQADMFYETQRSEVKIVTNAYRNFGSRVKNLKKKLDELLPTLTSPIPSPDINAPSPSPDSDLELPGDDQNQIGCIEIPQSSLYEPYNHSYANSTIDHSQGHNSADFTNNFSSFMGGNMDFDMRNIFNERSRTPPENETYNPSSTAMPIEVINMRPPKTESGSEFGGSSFLKSVLPSPDGAPNSTGIPGLGLDVPEPQTESPQRPDYSHLTPSKLNSTPTTPRMIAQGASLVNMNNHQMGHNSSICRNLSNETLTPSPYSSQGSQGNIPVPFDPSNSVPITPLPPPPLPPPMFLDDENCYNKLPPKFPTWTPAEGPKDVQKWSDEGKRWSNDPNEKAKWIENNDRWDSGSNSVWSNGVRRKSNIHSETPESPPIYEKSSFRDPVQYNDPQTQKQLLSSAADVDHRVIPAPLPTDIHIPQQRLIKSVDVDHRNLISLTGSPANLTNTNETSVTNNENSNLWSNTDQDYRRQVQPGDIVESVDMEMSDEETDGPKQKNRVLVDLRSQERMNPGLQQQNSPLLSKPPQPPPPPPPQQQHHMDMDMRMIPLPGNRSGPMQPDVLRGVHPPPPIPFHHSQEFPVGPASEFPLENSEDFGPNPPNYPSNLPPPGFIPNQPPDFHHQSRGDLYDFPEHQRVLPQDFHDDPQLRGRYSDHIQHPQHLRDAPMYHRNERGLRGRGFPRNRRDRYSDDHNSQRNQMRRLRPDNTDVSADTVVILDDNGMPIIPNTDEMRIQNIPTATTMPSVVTKTCLDDQLPNNENITGGHTSPDVIDAAHSHRPLDDADGPPGDTEEMSEDRSQEGSLARADEPPRNLSEHLEALMNSGKTGINELKRQSSNGNLIDSQDDDVNNTPKKRVLLPNGPQMDLLHPTVYDYEHGNSNFRQRLSTPGVQSAGTPFSSWRGGGGGGGGVGGNVGGNHLSRGRSGYRGSPRPPWNDRGSRGSPSGNFMPRGMKRGGLFRGSVGVGGSLGGCGASGGSFRGRGRGW